MHRAAPPGAADAPQPYLALLEARRRRQATLVARWMHVGFIHGVMNTDNMAISGETIDYGPCAFMDAYDPATVFSSIDHGGRYAYGNQPTIASVESGPARRGAAAAARTRHRCCGGRRDRGARRLPGDLPAALAGRHVRQGRARPCAGAGTEADATLVTALLEMLATQRVDLTRAMRSLSSVVRGDPAPAAALFDDPDPFDAWARRWQTRRSGSAPHRRHRRGDGPGQPRVRAPQPPGRGGARRGHSGGHDPLRRTGGGGERPLHRARRCRALHDGRAADFGPYRTFCGT